MRRALLRNHINQNSRYLWAPFLFLNQELGPQAFLQCLDHKQMPGSCSNICLLHPEVSQFWICLYFFRRFVLGTFPNLRNAWHPWLWKPKLIEQSFVVPSSQIALPALSNVFGK